MKGVAYHERGCRERIPAVTMTQELNIGPIGWPVRSGKADTEVGKAQNVTRRPWQGIVDSRGCRDDKSVTLEECYTGARARKVSPRLSRTAAHDTERVAAAQEYDR